MAHGMICPKCGKAYVGYKRPIGNPFGKGVWKCYKCNYGGDYKDFRNNGDKFKKSQKSTTNG